jgi:hypothetical protein
MMLSTAERAKALVVREAGRALGLAQMEAVFILRPISSEVLSSAKGTKARIYIKSSELLPKK